MSKSEIERLEHAIGHRTVFLLRKIGTQALDAFQQGPEYFQAGSQEGRAVGMFVLKRKPEVNPDAISADLRARVSVPIDEEGRIMVDDSQVPWAGLYVFLTPNAIGGKQRQVHEWLITPGAIDGGKVFGPEDFGEDTEVYVDDALETAYGNCTHMSGIDETPTELDMRAELEESLREQLKTAQYYDMLVGRYLALTNFSDIY